MCLLIIQPNYVKKYYDSISQFKINNELKRVFGSQVN